MNYGEHQHGSSVYNQKNQLAIYIKSEYIGNRTSWGTENHELQTKP
ncbi:unnamed protein product [Urochloa humidicola]